MLESLKFRHRISLLVALASVALTTVTAMALVVGRRGAEEVSGIETRYVPLLELDRDLQSLFASLTRALEDAAAAGEEAGLREADALRDGFDAALTAGAAAIRQNGADPELLRRELRAYYQLARAVSSDLVAGEPSEELLARAQAMRTAEQGVALHLAAATTPDRARTAAAFESALAAYDAVVTIDLVIACAAFALMLLLSWWIIRGAVRSLGEVSIGVERLARGDFSHEIRVTTRDEFGDLAREANQTALRLREFRELADREDWIKTGAAGLAGEIAGELDAAALGRSALAYLADYVGAPVAAVHAADANGVLVRIHAHAAAGGPAPPDRLAAGDEIVEQAARDGEIRLLSDLPIDLGRPSSAPGDGALRHRLVVPFSYEGRCLGVLELGFLEPPGPPVLELLGRIRDALAIAFRVAESRQRVQDLVHEMHRQADELRDAYGSVQEHNQALQTSEVQLQLQQEELRTANEELAEQTTAIEAQRGAVVKKNEELEEAQLVIEQKVTELGRASRYKSEFLANMSHELRTPLNSIMILSRILASNEDGRLTGKPVEFAQVIYKSGEELLALINDILDLAKIEAGKQEMNYGPVQLADLASYARQMFEPLATARGLNFDVELADGLPEVIQTDRMRVDQILKNLISNAIKFTDEGRISIQIFRPTADDADPARRAGPEEEGIAIAVVDTGAGIAPAKQQVIFEAFAQADGSTSRRYGGTGLGLAIARGLAVRLGGDLRVQSADGRGSTFVLHLSTRPPRRRATAASTSPVMHLRPPTSPVVSLVRRKQNGWPTDRENASPALPVPEVAAGGETILEGKRLLIVDDDMRNVYSLSNALQLARLSISAAADGIEALEQLDEHRDIDIVLMDIMMPRMDGHEAIRRIREQPRLRDLPIIALTARTMPGDRQKCIDAGANDFIPKPVNIDQLLALLRTWLGGAR